MIKFKTWGTIVISIFIVFLLLTSFKSNRPNITHYDVSVGEWRKFKTIKGMAHYGYRNDDEEYHLYFKDDLEYLIETRQYEGRVQYSIMQVNSIRPMRLPIKRSPVKEYKWCSCPGSNCTAIWCFNVNLPGWN